MTNLIDAHGLTKRYGGATVLDDVSLAVPAGCVVGLIGANGAGKTTAIRALMGLMELDAGEALLFGEPFGPHADDARARRLKRRIGVVFDTCPFIGDLPVKTAATIMKASFPAWKQGLFEDLLRRFALDPKKKIKDLSRGMGMKLQLACALAHEPDLLVLDEATAGLDPMARDEILDLLRAFMADEGRGILISSHITTDLEKIADRIVCIDQGRIAFDIEKDLITDIAGVAHCRTMEFERMRDSALFAEGGLRWIRQPMSVDVLVPDRFAFAKLFPEVACDRATIDDYLQLTLKGETR
ncbi:MAG: ABC transporter ATP-binding protein [Eggerthellaceae bacterium]|nr:ABC transporter ATP-binding protein [Eggerthellaceae bacterium]